VTRFSFFYLYWILFIFFFFNFLFSHFQVPAFEHSCFSFQLFPPPPSIAVRRTRMHGRNKYVQTLGNAVITVRARGYHTDRLRPEEDIRSRAQRQTWRPRELG
jgi:hypothetical protein